MQNQNTSSFVQKIESLLVRKPIILQILKFGCLGVLNTALDFIILYAVKKHLGISNDVKVWYVNVVSFSFAAVQSYLWNRYWIFANDARISLFKNFYHLVVVGLLGALGMAAVLIGAAKSFQAPYFWLVLVIFVCVEVGLWFNLGLHLLERPSQQEGVRFVTFFVVSLGGVLINTGVLTYGVILLSKAASGLSEDLATFAAKIAATFFSLIWNFLGYKLIVFKKNR